MNPEKIDIIKNWPTPQTILHIQQFLGLTGYYRKFIENYASISAPMLELIKKEPKWLWTTKHQSAFDALKRSMMEYPILRMPDLQKTFYLYTDACGVAIGAILSQKDSDNNEYVIQYISRTLKGAELSYGISNKETLAVYLAVMYFRVYLFNKFYIITDHHITEFLESAKATSHQIGRWSVELAPYQFIVMYKSGKLHTNADAISRLYGQDNEINTIEPSQKFLDPWENDYLMYYLKHRRFMSGYGKNAINRTIKQAKRYLLDETDVLWFLIDGKLYIVPRINERIPIISEAHSLGHYAPTSVSNTIREKYRWKNMEKDIKFFINECVLCAKYNLIQPQEHFRFKSTHLWNIRHHIHGFSFWIDNDSSRLQGHTKYY